jgi:hypothetical protein
MLAWQSQLGLREECNLLPSEDGAHGLQSTILCRHHRRSNSYPRPRSSDTRDMCYLQLPRPEQEKTAAMGREGSAFRVSIREHALAATPAVAAAVVVAVAEVAAPPVAVAPAAVAVVLRS